MFERVLEKIKEYDTVIIHRHTFPDGDALGSQLGLKRLIETNFKGKKVYAVGALSKKYAFMAPEGLDDIPDEYYENALSIVLDSAAKSLVEDTRFERAAFSVRIDHHIYCETFTDIEIVDTSFESCCGLITAFAMECGLALPVSAAEALYTGTVTDSGRFRFDSTTSGTFERVSFLLKTPFDISKIYSSLYSDDLAYIKLRASFVLKIKLTEKNVAYIFTTKEEVAASGYDLFSISRGFANVMADIRGVDIWVNFTESDNGVECELRSSKYNINPIAVKYGGGGHAKASGALVKDFDEAKEMLRDLDALTGD